MFNIYFTLGILLLAICQLQGQKREFPLAKVKTMSLEKISGTIQNATETELILTFNGNGSPYHMKAQNIKNIHIPRFPKPRPWGALIGAGIGMLPGAIILSIPKNPDSGFLDERRFDAFVGMVIGGIAGSIIGHQIRKNAGPKFKINGNIDTFRQQRNAINKFGYTN